MSQGFANSSGAVSDGDKGDITVTASGATWTIDNGVVSLAKMADVATSTVFYRKTAATGSPEVQTLATLKTDLGLTGTNSGDQNIFQTIAVSGQSDVVADSTTDTLTLAAGSGITITTNAGSDTVTIAASGGVTEGAYTPTLTNGINVAASTAYECVYVRAGNTVTVTGSVDIDPTTGGGTGTYLELSLPISSNFGSIYDARGTGVSFNQTTAVGLRVQADVADDRVEFYYVAQSNANTEFSFVFMYQVI